MKVSQDTINSSEDRTEVLQEEEATSILLCFKERRFLHVNSTQHITTKTRPTISTKLVAAVGSEEAIINQANANHSTNETNDQQPSHRQDVKARKIIDTHLTTNRQGQDKGSEGSGLAGNKRSQEEEEDFPRGYQKY